MTTPQAAIEERFPIYAEYASSPALFTFSGNGVRALQSDQRASDLRRVAAELRVTLNGDNAKYQPSLAMVDFAALAADLEALADA